MNRMHFDVMQKNIRKIYIFIVRPATHWGISKQLYCALTMIHFDLYMEQPDKQMLSGDFARNRVIIANNSLEGLKEIFIMM